MKNDTITLLIDPLLSAKLGKSISGELNFSTLNRLRDLARYDNKEISYSISFVYDEDNKCCITGKVQTTLQLECKRCLKFFPYQVITAFNLYAVKAINDSEDNLSKQLDVVLIENGLISITDIIEDEVILSLPEVPKHAEDDVNCHSIQKASFLEYGARQQKNPFSVLKQLDTFNDKK